MQHLSKFTLRFENDVWTVESTVQGEDFEAYSPVVNINLAEQRVDSMCNCMEAFNGPCRHVAATAIHFINSLDISEGKADPAPAPREDWRQSFRHFFGGTFEPETGRYVSFLHIKSAFPHLGRRFSPYRQPLSCKAMLW